jgi:hypothetical protein
MGRTKIEVDGTDKLFTAFLARVSKTARAGAPGEFVMWVLLVYSVMMFDDGGWTEASGYGTYASKNLGAATRG